MIAFSRALPVVLLLMGSVTYADNAEDSDKDDAVSVELAGVAIVRGGIPAEALPGFKPFGMEQGTRLALLFKRPLGKLICFDEAASRIDKLTDDRGTNLLEISHRLQKTGFLPYGCGITAKGTAAYVEIFGGRAPTAGSTQVLAQGKAVFRLGSETGELQSSTITMKPGAEIVIVNEDSGDRHIFQVERWKTGGAAGKGAKLTLLFRGDCRVFQGFQFFDDEGKQLKSQAAGVNRQNGADKNETHFHFLLDTVPERLALRVTYWSDMQVLEVPFKLATGIGG